MLSRALLFLVLGVSTLVYGTQVPYLKPLECSDGRVATLHNSYELEGKTLTHWSCDFSKSSMATSKSHDVRLDELKAKRQQDCDLCGAPCTTYCNTPAGGGPDPNDCQSLANSYAGKGGFMINPGSTQVWDYGSCQVYQTTPTNGWSIFYCYDDWAGVVSYLAWNCQSTQNAHGGSCHFYDDPSISWVQVQTV